MSTWTERPQDIENNHLPEGDIGGDVQRSDAWGRRFTRQRPDGVLDSGRWDVLTVAFYTAADDVNDDEAPATHIEMQAEWVVCTDPDDPGSTELKSDYHYERDDREPCTEAECITLRNALTLEDVDTIAALFESSPVTL